MNSASLRARRPPPGQAQGPRPVCGCDSASLASSLQLLSRTRGRSWPGLQSPWQHTQEHHPPAPVGQAAPTHCRAGAFERLQGAAPPWGGQGSPASVRLPRGIARGLGDTRAVVRRGEWVPAGPVFGPDFLKSQLVTWGHNKANPVWPGVSQ